MNPFNLNDVRDFLNHGKNSRVLARNLLRGLIELPSDELCDLLAKEYVDELERYEMSEWYADMEYIHNELGRFGLRLDGYLVDRYGTGRNVYDQASLMAMREEENERANVYP